MSTKDVPGANPANGDELCAGAWAEHEDGSLIFVEGAEGGRVIYSVFDMSSDTALEYRDSMSEKAFKDRYTQDNWTWHDKTAFPWDKIFDNFSPGVRHASADDHLNAAQRIAAHRNLDAPKEPDLDDKTNWLETIAAQATKSIITGFQKALKDLKP